MRRSEEYQIRPIVADDLERVLIWRNHPDINRYMLTRHEITVDEHLRWFEHARNDPSKRIFIFEHEKRALGLIHFSGVAAGGIADWGFYTAPEAPKGLGGILGAKALDCAFQKLDLHKVCGQVLAANEASIRFHKTLGFSQEGVLRDQHLSGDEYHDLICFGLLSQEWPPTGLNTIEDNSGKQDE
jgi:UDP-4-amino-4,6-dideoxy-N-acetyl-beta-L-altrosamine N-acetyltransferase